MNFKILLFFTLVCLTFLVQAKPYRDSGTYSSEDYYEPETTAKPTPKSARKVNPATTGAPAAKPRSGVAPAAAAKKP